MTRLLRLAAVAFIAIGLLALFGEARASERAEEQTVAEQLSELVRNVLRLAKSSNQAKLREIAHALMIPNYEVWLKGTFEEKGALRGAEAFKKNLEYNEAWLPGYFEFLAKQEGEIFVESLKAPTTPLSGVWCGGVLLVPVKSDVLYRVMWQKEEPGDKRRLANVGYFSFVEGRYRRLACEIPQLEPNSLYPQAKGAIRVGGNAQAARLITFVRAAYPPEAQKTKISGTVRLHVVLARDGTIEQVELVSGHPLLVKAAMDAVERWTYAPTLINLTPVRVDSSVDVVFAPSDTPAGNP